MLCVWRSGILSNVMFTRHYRWLWFAPLDSVLVALCLSKLRQGGAQTCLPQLPRLWKPGLRISRWRVNLKIIKCIKEPVATTSLHCLINLRSSRDKPIFLKLISFCVDNTVSCILSKVKLTQYYEIIFSSISSL